MTGTPQKLPEPPGERPAGAVRLTLLGNFALHAAGVPIAIPTKKNRALLAILALSPNGQATRERLCGLLWGERGEEQARSSLRQALAVLRRELGPGNGILRTRDDLVALHLPDLEVDVLQFDRWSRGEGEELRSAAALLRGELLADTSLHEEGFGEWLAGERRRLSEQAIETLDRLAAEERGSDQVGYARRLVDLDPLREASHRALIRAYHLAGETALAIRQYELCRDMLKRELGVEPAESTQELRRALAAPPAPRRQAAAEEPQARPPHGATESETPSIAVLPFLNLSGDAEQQYFSDGLTEDLTTDLSKVPGLKVIAAHSALQFRGEGIDPAEAARALSVRHVVQGSVRRVPGSIRVNAKLVDATNGVVKWAERYDRKLEDVHEIQTEIARQIAGVFTDAVALPGDRYRPASLEAFDLVMRGRKEWRNSDETGAKAAPLFERAIALDPNYGEAYRWLACGQAMSWLHFGAPEEPNRRLSMLNARKAVECDPGDAAAHAILAFILMYEREWDAASAEFETALKINPNDGDAWSNLSDLRVMEGRGRDAVYCAERALDRNPRNPRPLGSFYWLLGQAQIAAGNLEGAVATLRREETYATGSRRFLAAALALLGRMQEAHDEARLFLAANPHFSIRHWAETQPFRDLSMRDYFVEAYRKAGLPYDRLPTEGAKPKVAVLPLVIHGGENLRYLEEGIAEDIATELSRHRHLRVIASASAATQRNAGGPQQAGRALDASHVVTGSLRAEGDRFRLFAQLVDVATGAGLWSERYDLARDQLHETLDQVVGAIAATVESRIGISEAEEVSRRPIASWTAYDHYLKGRDLSLRYRDAEAVPYLDKATELDPSFAPAFAWRAIAYVGKDLKRSDSAMMDIAEQSARRAIELDERDARGHHALGYVRLWQKHPELTGHHYEKALALNPSDLITNYDKANWLTYMGKPDEGLGLIARLQERDPFPPPFVFEIRGRALFQLGHYADALGEFEKVPPDHIWLHWWRAACYAHLGRMAEARDEVRKLQLRKPDADQAFVRSLTGFASPALSQALFDGLRKAGLPD